MGGEKKHTLNECASFLSAPFLRGDICSSRGECYYFIIRLGKKPRAQSLAGKQETRMEKGVVGGEKCSWEEGLFYLFW
jgi:hypothetical protein